MWRLHFCIMNLSIFLGLPAAIVVATGVYNIENYRAPYDDRCMLALGWVYYAALLGPCCVLLSVNFIVFIMVTRVLTQRKGLGKLGVPGIRNKHITVAQVCNIGLELCDYPFKIKANICK